MSAETSAHQVLSLQLLGHVPSGFDPDYLKRLCASINSLSPIWLISGNVNVKLVDDAEIQALNKEYSGNDYPTDVLSFSYIEQGAKPLANELGDIAISYEIAIKQAAQAGTKLEDEVATLCLHGILHIFGFDHVMQDEQKVMDGLQKQILSSAHIIYRDFGWKNGYVEA
ncbi:MAG: rRNA maturation RNase YbeY [Candidatus Saccharimonadia bacterium]